MPPRDPPVVRQPIKIMDIKQEQFELPGMPQPVPEPIAEDVRMLREYLDHRGWVLAKQIKQSLGWDERTVRAVAAASRGHVISGQQGYRLTKQAPDDEVQHAVNWMRSQARNMTLRSDEIECVRRGSAWA